MENDFIIGYNFGIDDGAETKFGTNIELIIFNISEYNIVLISHVICHDHFLKNLKLLTNWWPV